MDDALLYAEIERLDGEMDSVPLVLRPLDVYHILIGNEDRDVASLKELSKVVAWYSQRYGPEASWNGVLSRDPIVLRGKFRILEIVHSAIKPKTGLETLLDKLTADGKPASPEEYRYLAMNSLESSADFSALHNLEMAPSHLTVEQRALSRRAWFDLRDVSAVLESSGNVQGAILHSHEAAEKYLKIALLHEGIPFEKLGRGKLGHDLVKLTEALIVLHAKYAFLKKPARDLHSLLSSMNVRYTSMKRSLRDAVDAYRLARHCCGFVAQQIQMDKLRGGPDVSLVLGRYYQDYSGRQYRFCGIERKDGESLAAMHLLEATDHGKTIDALITFKLPCSFHYRDIEDTDDLRRLERRFLGISQTKKNQRFTQHDPKITIDKIHESFDAMLSVTIPVKRADQN